MSSNPSEPPRRSTRRNAEKAPGAPPKLFARVDADGGSRKRKDAPTRGAGTTSTSAAAAPTSKKSKMSELAALVKGARGGKGGTADAPASNAKIVAGASTGAGGGGNLRAKEARELTSLKEHVRENAGKPLDAGWKVVAALRETGSQRGGVYFRYLAPSGERFRSRSEVSKWVSDGGVGEDPDVVLLDEFITSLGGKGKILPAMDPKKKWTVKIVQRGAEGGATGGAYKVYFSPAGERFESRTAVARRLGLMESDANPLAVALVPEKKAAKDAAAKTSTSTSTEKEREKKKREKDHLIQKDKKDAASKREKDPGAKKKKKKSKASAEPAERRYWEQVKVDGEVFKRGDCAYVISDKTVDLDDETTDEPCTACGEATRGDDFMLECDGCLRGWHGGCLNPALTAVPEGEWHCPMCLASRDGVAPPSAAGKRTAVGEFLSGNLHLCRVECIWSERGRFYFVGRWFALPEETHAGRRADHARREVFLTNNTDENGVDCLLRPAKVLSPAEFREDAARRAAIAAKRLSAARAARRKDEDATAAAAAAADDDDDDDDNEGGDDVFLCEYSYDSHFRRFRRRADWDDDDSDDDDGGRRWLTNHVPGGGGGVGGFKDDDDDYDGSDDDDDVEEDDGGEWEGERGDGRRASARRNGGNGRKTSSDARRGGGKKSSFLSRHLTASRRAAAKASGDGGVMGLGALAATKVDRAAPATALGRARVALSLSKTPGVLPCREREREQIFQFVQQSISAGADCKGRCLYISGVPGTGKTATVREVIRALKRKSRDGGLPRFNHVELNGLRLQTPAHAYSAIAEELVGERLAPNRACDVLTERFRDGKGSDGRVTVLVVDEVDLLVTRTQQLLYNLFDWPTHRRARLVILGIANTLDLPERLLPKIISRLGSNRVAFAPYKQAELKKIVAARLEEAGGGGGATGGSLLDAFESTAIELASRKVAGFNGCARRVLEMCRRAAELAEARVEARRRLEAGDASLITPADAAAAAHAAAVVPGGRRRPDKVDMHDIHAAQGEMFDSPDTTYVAAASRHERIFLAALVMELRRSGLSEVPVAGVMRTHENLCRTYGEPLPPAGCAAGVVCRLASQRLLLCDPGRKRSAQRVSLNMGRDDLVYALKETRVEKAIAAAAAAAARRERTGGGVGGIGGENGAGDAASAEGERGLDHGDIPWMKHLGL